MPAPDLAAGAEAAAQIAAAEADRDTAIGQAHVQVGQLVSAAEADRDQTRQAAGQAEQAARLAQPGSHPSPGRRASGPGRDQPCPRRRGQDAGRLPR